MNVILALQVHQSPLAMEDNGNFLAHAQCLTLQWGVNAKQIGHTARDGLAQTARDGMGARCLQSITPTAGVKWTLVLNLDGLAQRHPGTTALPLAQT